MVLKLLYIVSALDALGFSMVITTQGPYIYSLGGTQFYLGVMGSVSALITLIWNPIVGGLSDRLGRKIVLLQCLFICCIGNFLTSINSLTIIFIARQLTAMGTQIMTLLKSLIDDNTKSTDAKMEAINKMQALGGFCFIFGSLISGFLSELNQGYVYIYCIIGAMYGVNFGLISLIPTTKAQKNQSKKDESFNFLREINLAVKNLSGVNWSKFWDLFTIKLIVDLSLNIFQFNIGLIFMKRFGIVGRTFGFVFASVSIINIVTSLTMGKVRSYFYSRDSSGLSRLLHGIILLILAFLGLSSGQSVWIYLACLVPLSVARVLIDTTFTEVLLARASSDEKGTIMGAFDSTLALGGLVAPLLSGIISDLWGENMAILLCIIPLTIGAVLSYSQKVKVQ